MSSPDFGKKNTWDEAFETGYIYIIHIKAVERSQEAGGVRRKICVWDITECIHFTHTH